MEKYLIKRTSGITGMTRRFDKDKNFTLLNIFCKMVTEQMSRVFRCLKILEWVDETEQIVLWGTYCFADQHAFSAIINQTIYAKLISSFFRQKKRQVLDSSLTPFAWSKLQDAKNLNKFFFVIRMFIWKKNFKKVKKKTLVSLNSQTQSNKVPQVTILLTLL